MSCPRSGYKDHSFSLRLSLFCPPSLVIHAEGEGFCVVSSPIDRPKSQQGAEDCQQPCEWAWERTPPPHHGWAFMWDHSSGCQLDCSFILSRWKFPLHWGWVIRHAHYMIILFSFICSTWAVSNGSFYAHRNREIINVALQLFMI